MSWAEIKKAVNSNIDIPLDKLVSGANVKIVGGRGSIPTTVIDITGKGLLNVMIVSYGGRSGRTSTPYVKLEIDGEVYYDVALYADVTGTNLVMSLVFANVNHNVGTNPIVFIGGSDMGPTSVQSPNNGYIPFSSQRVQVSNAKYNSGGNTPICNGMIADQSIPFSKSLKITTSAASSQSYDSWYVNYTLLD